MTDVRKDGIVPDPSQLAEMQATDARLDRIGRRRPEPEDLDDPVFAALAGLATEVDVVDPSQDAAVARLIEVLDGRPLWVLDGEDLADADAEAAQDMIVLDDPAWEARGRQIIDLRREAGADSDDEADPSARADEPAPTRPQWPPTSDGAEAAESEEGAEAARRPRRPPRPPSPTWPPTRATSCRRQSPSRWSPGPAPTSATRRPRTRRPRT